MSSASSPRAVASAAKVASFGFIAAAFCRCCSAASRFPSASSSRPRLRCASALFALSAIAFSYSRRAPARLDLGGVIEERKAVAPVAELLVREERARGDDDRRGDGERRLVANEVEGEPDDGDEDAD